MNLRERIEALQQPSPVIDGYGRRKCGCSWDSGPYDVPCDQHDEQGLYGDVHRELREAAREAVEHSSAQSAERLREAVEIADALAAAKPGPGLARKDVA